MRGTRMRSAQSAKGIRRPLLIWHPVERTHALAIMSASTALAYARATSGEGVQNAPSTGLSFSIRAKRTARQFNARSATSPRDRSEHLRPGAGRGDRRRRPLTRWRSIGACEAPISRNPGSSERFKRQNVGNVARRERLGSFERLDPLWASMTVPAVAPLAAVLAFPYAPATA
jgi:hypothetical protein